MSANQAIDTLMESARVSNAKIEEIQRVLESNICVLCWPAQRALIRDHSGDPLTIPKNLKLGRRPPTCHPQPENCYMGITKERRIREIEEKWGRRR
jgi:hypothetical protein